VIKLKKTPSNLRMLQDLRDQFKYGTIVVDEKTVV
jgi:hypothetical protein